MGDRNWVQQVAVGGVDFDGVDTEPLRPLGGADEGAEHAVEAGLIERLRGRLIGLKRDGRGRHGRPAAFTGRHQAAALPGHVVGGLAASMGELDGDRHRGMAAHGGQHPAEGIFRGVRPQAEIGRRNTAFRFDRSGLDDQQAGAGMAQVAVVHQVPVGRFAVVGRILAHRRNRDAVGQAQRADRIGGEQLAHGRFLNCVGGHLKNLQARSCRYCGRFRECGGPGADWRR